MKKLVGAILIFSYVFIATGCAITPKSSNANSFDFWQQQLPERKLVAVAETSSFSDTPQRVVISRGKDPTWLESFWGKLTGRTTENRYDRYDIY